MSQDITMFQKSKTPDVSCEKKDQSCHMLSQLKLCVVEDNPNNAELMREFLEVLGVVNTYFFDDARSCLTFLKKSKPDINLFLLDLSLPVMDGFSLLSSIKRISVYKRSLFIAVTAMVLPKQIQKIKAVQFTYYIQKPICFDLFETLLKDAHQNLCKQDQRDFSCQN